MIYYMFYGLISMFKLLPPQIDQLIVLAISSSLYFATGALILFMKYNFYILAVPLGLLFVDIVYYLWNRTNVTNEPNESTSTPQQKKRMFRAHRMKPVTGASAPTAPTTDNGMGISIQQNTGQDQSGNTGQNQHVFTPPDPMESVDRLRESTSTSDVVNLNGELDTIHEVDVETDSNVSSNDSIDIHTNCDEPVDINDDMIEI